MAWTKEERAEYMRKWREEHREEIRASRRYYYKRNREKVLAANRPSNIAYRNLHREELNAKQRAYYAAHKDDPVFKRKAYENTKRWIENNRDKWNERQREYKKRKALAEINAALEEKQCTECKYFVGCEKAVWVRGCDQYTEN